MVIIKVGMAWYLSHKGDTKSRIMVVQFLVVHMHIQELRTVERVN